MKRAAIIAFLTVAIVGTIVGAQPGRLGPQGGTITHVNLGTGGTGSANGGPVTLNVQARSGGGISVTNDDIGLIPSCGSTQILKWSGSSWACSDDAIGAPAPSVLSPTAITGTVNDWAPTGYTTATTVIRIDTSGTVTLGGLTGGSAGRQIILQFIGANNVTLTNQTGGTAANQFLTGTGANITFGQSQSALLTYDGTTTRWRVTANTAVSSNNAGTSNTLPKFSSASVLTNSSVTDNGTTVTVGNAASFSSTATVTSTFTANGNIVLGDATADTITANGTSSFVGPATVREFRGTAISPAAITGTINDWAPTGLSTATTVIISTSGTVTLTGLTGGSAGRRIRLYNDGANNVDISHNSGSSAAANRIVLSTPTSSKTLRGGSGCAIELEYRGTTAWYEVGFSCTQQTLLALTTTDALSVGGALTHGFIRGNAILPTGLTGTINDWAPASLSTARIIQASSSATATITGLTGGDSGRLLMLCNVGTNTIQLVNENAGSTNVNRFRLPAASTVIIPGTSYWAANGYECVELVYDGTLTRWTVAADGRSTRSQFETTTQLYSAGTTNMIGTVSAAGDVNIGDASTDVLDVDSTTALNGPTTIGDADTDTLNSRAIFGVSGANPSVSGTGCAITGEAQSFRLTTGSGGGTTSCVVTFNKIMTAPYCVFSPANENAADLIADPAYGPYISSENASTLTFTLQTSQDVPAVWNFWCPTRY